KRPAEQARVLREALVLYPLEELLLTSRRYGFLGDYILYENPDYRAKLHKFTPGQLGGDTLEYHMFKANLHKYSEEPDLARAHYDSARTRLEAKVREQPGDDGFRMGLALVYAALDRKEDAIREARRAVQILPMSKDAFNGMDMVAALANVYVSVGEFDAALDQLETLLALPCKVWVEMVDVAPWFAPLRDHPRLRALLKRTTT
ncbi:MAG TPA: hypothetical protein VFY42_05985, partial [Gemmatimonadales bacterium]|nr:hypothetical protein [Gemmatimonadales bacterium]